MDKNGLYIYGEKNYNVPEHKNFGKFVLEKLRLINQYEVAMVNASTKEEYTFKDVIETAIKTSKVLTNIGIKKGDVVGFGSEKRNEFVPTLLGIVMAGATYTSYDLFIAEDSLRHKLSVTKPKFFISSRLFWGSRKELLTSFDAIQTFIFLDKTVNSKISIEELCKGLDPYNFEPVEVNGDEHVACIAFSSGTTGLSKGIELTHLNCIYNSIPYDFDKAGIKSAFIFGDVQHNYELFVTYKLWIDGKKAVYITDVSFETVMDAIEKYQVDIAFFTPLLLRRMFLKDENINNYNISSLKYLYSRSLPLQATIIEEIEISTALGYTELQKTGVKDYCRKIQLHDRFPHLKIIQGYGMTECGEPSSELRCIDKPLPGSVGKANPGIIIKVVDLTTHKLLGPNQPGEIRVKGECLMKGYIDINLSSYLDEEGFYKTGDLGYYNEDQYFFVIDRLKDIIANDGLNEIIPADLETIIFHHPEVLEVTVVGKTTGEGVRVPVAAVVRRHDSSVTEKELIDFVAAYVPAEKQVREIHFFSELPKIPKNNLRGKISRYEVQKMLNY